ncbi:acyl-CoA dehydrogenase family protein [Nocardioides marmotae]|uniref:acyl-CoA dehydrogenase family protein n=1 Tax=Nocardioides marmotae TaxID=2663857 RepID=UPI0012B57985|nr:acyl-CoA dehydrogenase family protein [Nocardioides marmotae]MBC9734511.1 acyl-CoA dehydrogenase family protein [Nocardioides marmotae]MTB85611.1 acyl-CoA dehydrogenase [Nocardioides marmotae]
MDFTYDEEQQALREAVRGLVGKAYSDYEQRRQTVAAEPGFDEAQWGRMAEMGLLGLPFSEDDGGVGAGPVEISVVAEELGRVVAPEPYLTSVVWAGGLVSAVGTAEQRAEVLGALSAGQSVLAPALAEPGRRWTDDATEVTASEDGGAWTLTGTKEPVPQGARADVLVVSAMLPSGGTGLFLVPGDAAGLTRTGYATHDGGRAAKVTFEATPATPLGEPGADVAASIATVTDLARIMACNEAVGAMETALRTTSAYLTSRKQFGVTLNTFQALTFRAADMYISLELAKSLAVWATMVVASGSPAEIAEAARRASLQVARAGRHIGQEAIQLHGGIGMTAEYSIGAYTSRLTFLDHLLGDATFHLRSLAATVGDHAEVDPLP